MSWSPFTRVGIDAPSDGSIEYVGSRGGCTSRIGAAIMSTMRPFASSHRIHFGLRHFDQSRERRDGPEAAVSEAAHTAVSVNLKYGFHFSRGVARQQTADGHAGMAPLVAESEDKKVRGAVHNQGYGRER